MFNPHFDKVFESVERIVDMYVGEASRIELKFTKDLDEEGNLIQYLPYLDIQCKG